MLYVPQQQQRFVCLSSTKGLRLKPKQSVNVNRTLHFQIDRCYDCCSLSVAKTDSLPFQLPRLCLKTRETTDKPKTWWNAWSTTCCKVERVMLRHQSLFLQVWTWEMQQKWQCAECFSAFLTKSTVCVLRAWNTTTAKSQMHWWGNGATVSAIKGSATEAFFVLCGKGPSTTTSDEFQHAHI